MHPEWKFEIRLKDEVKQVEDVLYWDVSFMSWSFYWDGSHFEEVLREMGGHGN